MIWHYADLEALYTENFSNDFLRKVLQLIFETIREKERF